MEPFIVHVGVGAPLRRSSVDTDQIVPARYLKSVGRSGFGEGLFAAWRESSDFVLRQPAYKDASVLVAGVDFGIGSSREAAVWALQDGGFRVVIAPRFGDIFRTNAGKSGLLAVQLGEPEVERLWDYLDASPGATITVDLDRCLVSAGDGFEEPFEVNEYVRWQLLNGLDEIATTLSSLSEIQAFEATRPSFKPRVTLN
ncbi:MAG TPA: 3-isopropylmalate dehydratase small subunit [Acidimicrobiales bacterium]